jgi:hypothetical protein
VQGGLGLIPTTTPDILTAKGRASPDLFETLESALETEKGLGQKATGEVLAGLGDEAFAVHNKTTGDTTIHVLRRGDVWLEVKADTLDHARKLAEEVLQRLGPKSAGSVHSRTPAPRASRPLERSLPRPCDHADGIGVAMHEAPLFPRPLPIDIR